MPATPAFTPDYSFLPLAPTTPAQRLDAIADQLELALNGGRASDDSPYDWPFLRLCAEQAKDAETTETEAKNAQSLQANYAARKKDELETYFINQKNKSQNWEAPDADIQSFLVPVLYDTARKEQYFIIPTPVVNLRRWQNLESERTVREIMPRDRTKRDDYQFVYTGLGHRAHRGLPGGLLGCWGFYTEQTTGADPPPRVYFEAPTGCEKMPDGFALLADFVIRSAADGFPDAALWQVEDARIYQRGLELALLRTRQDRVEDSNPMPTQVQ
ncbi:MAG: hypothetical protein ACRYFX_18880 [Janthinobacterium lividum]